MSYMFGFQDVNLVLREALKAYMNNPEVNDKLKSRWITHKKAMETKGSFKIDKEQLDLEWSEVCNMTSLKKNVKKEQEQQQQKMLEENQLSSKLTYLEDIHIFALANFLKRPIIVLSLETLRNIEPIFLRGIYLPLLNPAAECFKDPILIAFHNFHFMPLLTAKDVSSDTYLTELQFHFDNIDFLMDEHVDVIDYAKKFSTSPRKKHAHRCLPIIYYNLEQQMMLHFLEESEQSLPQEKFTDEYLDLVEVDIEIEEVNETHARFLSRNKKSLTTFCCRIGAESRNWKRDGISSYIDFLSESIEKKKQQQQHQRNTSSSSSRQPLAEIRPGEYARADSSKTFTTRSSTYLPNESYENQPDRSVVFDKPYDLPTPPSTIRLCQNCYSRLSATEDS